MQQIFINNGTPTKLKHGDDKMPPEPLGPCSFSGCKKQALFYCFVPLYDPRPHAIHCVKPVCCDEVFCEDHAVWKLIERRTKHTHWSYYIRACQPCIDENRKRERRVNCFVVACCCTCPLLFVFVIILANVLD